MITIRELLDAHYEGQYSDAGLAWGGKASDYGSVISEKMGQGFRPVLVELDNDIGLDTNTVEIVDHHGKAAGNDKPTSLEQVYHLLGKSFDDASEEHKAVAANDRGYVYELRNQGFSKERIRSIREKEWTITGITADQISQAECAIRNRLECLKGFITVESENDRASLIADLLLNEFSDRWELGDVPACAIEPEILLVEGPTEWNLYAAGRIIEAFVKRYPLDGAWSGGALPDRGFWGAPKAVLRSSRDDLIETIKEQTAAPRPCASGSVKEDVWLLSAEPSGSLARDPGSFTQFILPVAYSPHIDDADDPSVVYKQISFEEFETGSSVDERNASDPASESTCEYKTTSKDEHHNSDPELTYERRRYFTEETGNMLYQHSAWFELRGCSAAAEAFHFYSQNTRRTIRLQWSRPKIVLFNWSVARAMADRCRQDVGHPLHIQGNTHFNPMLNAFVILEIHPVEPITLAELMEFNETFRHLQVPFEKYYAKRLAEPYADLLDRGFPWEVGGKGSLELDKAQGPNSDKTPADRLTWGKWLDLLEFPVRDESKGFPTHYRVVPRDWIKDAELATLHRSWAKQEHALKPAEPKALVWSCAVMSKEAQSARAGLLDRQERGVKKRTPAANGRALYRVRRPNGAERQSKGSATSSPRERNVRAGDWIRFLNIDCPAPPGKDDALIRHEHLLEASEYEKQWAERESITYQRWAHWGSLYGFTGHSGCAFLPDGRDPPFWRQWRTIYRDQALFLLYERATLFRFSRSISSLTQIRFEAEGGPDMEKQRADRHFETDFGGLRRHFVSFANLYQFPLLSTEQQSLEMYNAQRAALDVDPLYKEVQSQIDNAHAYASLASQRRATDLTTIITVLGIPLLVAGLLASLLGMDMAVPYAAVIDLASRIGGADLVDAISSSSGLVRVALWLSAVLVVLIPIRLFENRLVDFASSPALRVRRSIGRVLTAVAAILVFTVASVLIYKGIMVEHKAIGIATIAVGSALLLLLLWPLHLLRRTWNAIGSATGDWQICRAWRAFRSKPRPKLPLSRQFTEIIERQIEAESEFENRSSKKELK